MSLRIIKRNPSGGDKEVILEIDPIQSSPGGQTYSVKGKVTNDKGVVQVDKTVVLFDSVLIADPTWGKMIPIAHGYTTLTGEYLIFYSTTVLNGKLFADLQVRVYDVPQGTEPLDYAELPEAMAKSALYVDALPQETIDINVATTAFVGVSEYTKIQQDIAIYLIDPSIEEIRALTLSDIEILASKTSLDKLLVGTYLKAQIIEDDLLTLLPAPPTEYDLREVVYGMLRFGLPLTTSEFLATSIAEKTEAIRAVAESNIIDPDIAVQEEDGSYPTISDILMDMAVAEAGDGLSETIQDENGEVEIADSLISQLLDNSNALLVAAGQAGTIDKSSFYAFYLANFESSDDFWGDVVGTVTAVHAAAIKHVFQLNTIIQSNIPLMERLIEDNHFTYDSTNVEFLFDSLIGISRYPLRRKTVPAYYQ